MATEALLCPGNLAKVDWKNPVSRCVAPRSLQRFRVRRSKPVKTCSFVAHPNAQKLRWVTKFSGKC